MERLALGLITPTHHPVSQDRPRCPEGIDFVQTFDYSQAKTHPPPGKGFMGEESSSVRVRPHLEYHVLKTVTKCRPKRV